MAKKILISGKIKTPSEREIALRAIVGRNKNTTSSMQEQLSMQSARAALRSFGKAIDWLGGGDKVSSR
jgi:hypothetical protein